GRGITKRVCRALSANPESSRSVDTALIANTPRNSQTGRAPERPYALATTSPISMVSIVTESSTVGRARIMSTMVCAAPSDSNETIDVPLPPESLTQYPAMNPGAEESCGTISSRSRAVPVASSLTVTLVTTACMALPFWLLTVASTVTDPEPGAGQS